MRIIALVASALFLLSGAVVFIAEGQESTDPFGAVPQAQRESLREDVAEDILYETGRQWPEMYKLYDNPRNISLDQFIREMNKSIRLLGFTPNAVTYIPPSDDWRIDGCAVFAGNALGKMPIDAVITARRISDDWRLGTVAVSPRDQPNCTAEGQESADLFSTVPQAQRESLREAVAKDITYRTKRQWPEMYKLYDNQENISLDKFVYHMNKHLRLLEFTPYAVTYIPPAEYWRIDGCAVFAGNILGEMPIDAVIIARRVSNDWRLGDVAVSPRREPMCTAEKK